MYNKKTIDKLISVVENYHGIGSKDKLTKILQETFQLTLEGKVYACNDFAIRFSYSKKNTPSFSNTVLSLAKLRKYDDRPFIICLVTPEKNYLFLANSTFLKKVSHSSKQLRMDNIKGSFNGSDILRILKDVPNEPNTFESLYAIHEGFTYEENLERLVAATNNIEPKKLPFTPNAEEREIILQAPQRSLEFFYSKAYKELDSDLRSRVMNVHSEIVEAAQRIDNVNIRGRVIESLITLQEGNVRQLLIHALRTKENLPALTTENGLGDYDKRIGFYHTNTDIKTKMTSFSSNPKGYNIDKILKFLAMPGSVYLIFIVTIDEHNKIYTKLCSLFDPALLQGTRIFHHWAGRGSRGVTQYSGESLQEMVQKGSSVDVAAGKKFLKRLLDL